MNISRISECVSRAKLFRIIRRLNATTTVELLIMPVNMAAKNPGFPAAAPIRCHIGPVARCSGTYSACKRSRSKGRAGSSSLMIFTLGFATLPLCFGALSNEMHLTPFANAASFPTSLRIPSPQSRCWEGSAVSYARVIELTRLNSASSLRNS